MFVKQAGVSLEPGDIIGILTLDDPSRVKHAKPFEGQLPDMGQPSIIGSKPHQRLAWDIDILNSTLDGFDNDWLPKRDHRWPDELKALRTYHAGIFCEPAVNR